MQQKHRFWNLIVKYLLDYEILSDLQIFSSFQKLIPDFLLSLTTLQLVSSKTRIQTKLQKLKSFNFKIYDQTYSKSLQPKIQQQYTQWNLARCYRKNRLYTDLNSTSKRQRLFSNNKYFKENPKATIFATINMKKSFQKSQKLQSLQQQTWTYTPQNQKSYNLCNQKHEQILSTTKNSFSRLNLRDTIRFLKAK